jgi:hypothetical protein
VLYLDDRLPSHPKILKAGARIGKNGPALALAMYVTGLSYAREHTTDGFIPDAFIGSCFAFASPGAIADAIAARSVQLWRRVRGGYQIHDYHDWNRKASEIKAQREKWRARKAKQRRGGNGAWSPQLSPGDTKTVPPVSHRDSRARTRSHVPRTTKGGTQPLSRDPGTSTAGVLTGRCASGILTFRKLKLPTHRILCAIARAELDAEQANTGASYADWIEGMKIRLARQGFAYPPGEALAGAIEAVEHARRRRA